MPAGRRWAALALVTALAACTRFAGVYLDLAVAAPPAADCAQRIIHEDSGQQVRRRVWHGDPLLTGLGVAGPVGDGVVLSWPDADGQELELWLLRTPDGPLVRMIRESPVADPAEAAAIHQRLRTLAARVLAACVQ